MLLDGSYICCWMVLSSSLCFKCVKCIVFQIVVQKFQYFCAPFDFVFDSEADLAQNRYFEDEAFIGYLKYLQYWQGPEYIKFIM